MNNKAVKSLAGISRPDLVEDEQKLRLANLIFGEGISENYDVKKMIGSTALNRLDYDSDFYGRTLDDVMNKPSQYYAVHDKDPIAKNPYMQAATLQFKNQSDANGYLAIQSLVDRLMSEPDIRSKGTHFFKQKEARKLQRTMKERGQFVEKIGPYFVYDEPH